MNCHPIIAEAEARGVSDMLAFLRDELPRRWMAGYKEATRRPTNILRIELGTFVYIFDFVTELEIGGGSPTGYGTGGPAGGRARFQRRPD